MANRVDIEAIARQGRRRWPWRLAMLLVFALAGGGLWYQYSGRDAAPSTRYRTAEATVADIVVTVTATGTVEPINQVEISSELSGRVRSVEVDFNDTVKKGQTLAQLDTDKLEANVEHAEATLMVRRAGLAEANATLDEKRAAHDRAVHLEGQGISSREVMLATRAAYERAQAAIESARAGVLVAEAELKIERTNLAKSCICSPIDGIVLGRTVEPGQIVASSLQAPILFTLAENLERMELTVDIDEADIGKIAPGNPARFTVEAFQDRAFEAVITQLRFAPKTVDGVVTYEAILDVDNRQLALRPGMTATAEITVARVEAALAVPNAALRFSPPVRREPARGGSGLLGMILPRPQGESAAPIQAAARDGWRSVWVLRAGAPAEVKVRTGETDGEMTHIAEGELKAGDKVILDIEAAR